MHSSGWVAIFRHIPVEHQNRFMLVTATGQEISVQSFLRIEQELVVVKGRLAGSQDAGRVFFIPYAHLDYFGYSQPVKDEEFNALFGTLSMSGEGEAVVPAAEAPETTVAAPPRPEANGNGLAAVAAEVNGTGAARPPGSEGRAVIRSEVLERFRARPASSPRLPSVRPTQP